jgi:hypothetical protein
MAVMSADDATPVWSASRPMVNVPPLAGLLVAPVAPTEPVVAVAPAVVVAVLPVGLELLHPTAVAETSAPTARTVSLEYLPLDMWDIIKAKT